MAKKVLLLGSTGKMGTALRGVFDADYRVIAKNSKDFNALDFEQTRCLIEKNAPDIVVNTVALLGIDPCEKEPEKALRLNALFPKLLAELSNSLGFLLAHFSTDAVFDGLKADAYCEGDPARPLNVYGFTKYGGDCFIQAAAKRYYIFRVSILFGETAKNSQFVEKMLEKVKGGSKALKIADDIISSPTYSKDAADRARSILESGPGFGLYHLANEGRASLYELMREIAAQLNLDVNVKKGSYRDFPFVGIKNKYTPLRSEKIPFLRPWKEAAREYCRNIKGKTGR